VNVTGTHILTTAIVPLLFKSTSPRMIFITSGTASLTETEDLSNKLSASPAAGWPKPKAFGGVVLSYRCSKTGMNMIFREWVRLLRNDPIKVFCISPGFLDLNGMTPEQLMAGALDSSAGGNFVKDVVEGKRDQDAGKIMRQNGIQPW
jgi:NAD(P)-dependent dehydrogenase (short-subunit alcohol dehydrogenase family)